jgi:opacity protein-like surface antigen
MHQKLLLIELGTLGAPRRHEGQGRPRGMVFADDYHINADGLTVGAGVEVMLAENVALKTAYRLV